MTPFVSSRYGRMVARVPLVGTYLDPPWLLGFDLPDPHSPGAADVAIRAVTERAMVVAAQTQVEGYNVHLTHGSGVFVNCASVRAGRADAELALDAERKVAARICNLVICEMALAGVIASAVSPADMCHAMLEDGKASIWVAAGLVQARSWATQAMVTRQDLGLLNWPKADSGMFEEIDGAPTARRLEAVSAALPGLVASAIFYRYRGRPAECVMAAWIAIEQLLDQAWTDSDASRSLDASHTRRLNDTRTFTANVRTEILLRIGRLEETAYQAIQIARKHRNDLAHRAEVNEPAANECLTALQLALDSVLR